MQFLQPHSDLKILVLQCRKTSRVRRFLHHIALTFLHNFHNLNLGVTFLNWPYLIDNLFVVIF